MLMLSIFLIILLIVGAGFLTTLTKTSFSASNAATLALKLFCIILGVIAGVVFLLVRKIVPYVVKYVPLAITWTISAVVTAALLIYAGGRKIFHGESITDFVEKLIPDKKISQQKDFSLLAIELTDSINNDITSKLKNQYEKILSFFKPFG